MAHRRNHQKNADSNLVFDLTWYFFSFLSWGFWWLWWFRRDLVWIDPIVMISMIWSRISNQPWLWLSQFKVRQNSHQQSNHQPSNLFGIISIGNVEPGDVKKFLSAVFNFKWMTYFRPRISACQASTMLHETYTYDISTKCREGKSKSCKKSGLKSLSWFWPEQLYLHVS